ncbi:MAG: polysaccharide deacetylase family protein [Flavobacteriaceae bacterium]|nr:polysaccharide deacetylase family protein [Flavobacteriaceae bacterium]
MIQILILLNINLFAYSQKKVAITIDDVPNTIRTKYYNKPILSEKIDSLKIPVTIFINEGLLYQTNIFSKNLELLENWAQKKYVSLGNHSFHHSRYSTIKIDSFKTDILKGAEISGRLAKKYKKAYDYFRFPFNDLGKDSVQQVQIKQFLDLKGYQIAPFTIESSDWMFNCIYEHYLNKGDQIKAKQIGELYVDKTLDYFIFFEEIARDEYNRDIRQIYLCHDNTLNTHFLPILIRRLKKRGYKFISLENALTDRVYKQENTYFKKWGISWIYRWINDGAKRIELMKQEPSMVKVERLYDKIMNSD